METQRLTPSLLREIDRMAIEEYNIPGLQLMESAAQKVVDCISLVQQKLSLKLASIILCGKGNNGGDGYAIARLLHDRKWKVIVIPFCDPVELTGDALVNYKRMMELKIEVRKPLELEKIDLYQAIMVDAIYGTGFRPPSKIDFRDINRIARLHQHEVIAVDVPSGMDASDGTVIDGNAIKAVQTVTFVCEKTGFARPDAHYWTGKVIVADIGIPAEIIEKVCKGKPSG